MRATLSKASPAASSRVWPSTSWPSWSRTAASRVWPPLATRQRNGGSSGSGSRKLAATWPWRWSTGISGRRRGAAIAFAVLTPTRRAPIRPGPDRHRDRLDVLERGAGLGQRGLDHRDGELEVMARGDLGDDAAEARVRLGLRGDRVGEDRVRPPRRCRPESQPGRAGVVARTVSDAREDRMLGAAGAALAVNPAT